MCLYIHRIQQGRARFKAPCQNEHNLVEERTDVKKYFKGQLKDLARQTDPFPVYFQAAGMPS